MLADFALVVIGSISKSSGAKGAFHRRSLLTEQTSTRPISAASNGVSAIRRSLCFSVLQKHLGLISETW
jgi:hypothetical protein